MGSLLNVHLYRYTGFITIKIASVTAVWVPFCRVLAVNLTHHFDCFIVFLSLGRWWICMRF